MAIIARPQFCLSCRDALEDAGHWLADLVTRQAQQGAGLVEGTRFQIGWSVLTLVPQDGKLVLCEPDFDNDSLNDVRHGVSITLDVLGQQRALLARVDCTPRDCRFDDKVVVYKGCLDEPDIYAERNEPGEGDSGWYVGPMRDHETPGVDELESLRTFQLLHRRPALLAGMFLPVGWMMVLDGDRIVGIADDNDAEALDA